MHFLKFHRHLLLLLLIEAHQHHRHLNQGHLRHQHRHRQHYADKGDARNQGHAAILTLGAQIATRKLAFPQGERSRRTA